MPATEWHILANTDSYRDSLANVWCPSNVHDHVANLVKIPEGLLGPVVPPP